jgi:hypothetical protein
MPGDVLARRNGHPRRLSRLVLFGLGTIGAALLPGAPAHPAWARTWSQADPQTAAIQAVIQRNQQDRVQALATGDPAKMSGTATASYYRQAVQVRKLLDSFGVTSLVPTQLTWGPINVDANTATATTTETWHYIFRDGDAADSVTTNIYTLVHQGGAWLIEADRRVEVAGPGATNSAPAPSLSEGQNTSANWSGYFATGGGSYTSVSATWKVPQPLTPTGSIAWGATWVGIGGVADTDLIQAGTGANVVLGRARFEAWIETLPQVAQSVQLAVTPGDSVTVSIDEQGAGSGNWQISISNNTTGQSYQTGVSYTSTESSAEWIEEAPTGATGVLPLDNFQSVEFSIAATMLNGQSMNLAQASAEPLTMLDESNQPLAVPSSLGSDGGAFTITRTSTPATWDTGGPGN